jgi:hypothetical protein
VAAAGATVQPATLAAQQEQSVSMNARSDGPAEVGPVPRGSTAARNRRASSMPLSAPAARRRYEA